MTDVKKAVELVKAYIGTTYIGQTNSLKDALETLITAAEEAETLREQLDANAEHIGDLLDVHKVNEGLREQVNVLREALEWYANTAFNYAPDGITGAASTEFEQNDIGRRAREALATLNGGGA